MIEGTKKIKPLAVVNGVKLYTFAEVQALNLRDLKLEKADGKKIDLGQRAFTEDGAGYKRSRVKRAAVDPNVVYENRYRKTKDGYEVVIDYRAITEQASGHVYTNNVIVYKIGKVESAGKGKADEIAVIETKVVSAEEFINKFKEKLNVASMIRVQGAIAKRGNATTDGDNLEL